MKNINITVENKRATVVGSPVIICGNSDYTVTFAFDSDWNVTGVRTARFVYVKEGKVQHEDVVFSGNTVAVPILSGIDSVKIGVFAGELRTTTPAVVRCGASILCGSGEVHEPTPDVYDQIMALFNDLAERGGFGATEAQAQQIAQNQADIAALVSGTKKAGKAVDAETLGGKAASYFAALTELAKYLPLTGGTVTGDINQKTDAETFIMHQLRNAKRNVYFQIAPDGGFYLYDATVGNYIFNANLAGGYTWQGIASKNLPLSGGTVDGNLAVNGTLAANGTLIANDVNNAYSYIVFRSKGTNVGYLGINAGGEPAFMDTAYAARTILHTGNMASHVLPKSGGEIVSENYYPIGITNNAYEHCLLRYKGKSGSVGSLGFYEQNNPSFMDTDGNVKSLLHTGNSAKVHIGTSAPSDTSALWIDTSA